jgi:hypothetical protein
MIYPQGYAGSLPGSVRQTENPVLGIRKKLQQKVGAGLFLLICW